MLDAFKIGRFDKVPEKFSQWEVSMEPYYKLALTHGGWLDTYNLITDY